MPKHKLDQNIVREKIKQLWTDKKIGDIFGVTRQAVYQFRRYNIITKVRDRNKERNQEIAEMRDKGISYAEIGKKFELDISSIYRIWKSIGKQKTKKP